MSAAIIRLDTPGSWEACGPAPERILQGHPEHRAWNAFTDASGRFFCGRWSSSPGKWRVRYTENELCVLTAGRVIIESTAGERQSFAAGDAFVVPAGFEGTWTVQEECVKVYAIFESQG
ncbi:MAG TPA: cupin domain-containing protein [Steroidobacteraceae bacterium]|nr:cupin domain-containing protein [Steroidobacteraceae bacterium]